MPVKIQGKGPYPIPQVWDGSDSRYYLYKLLK